jgi:YVTN family beta-propeller protein
VANNLNDTVSVIRTSDNSVTATIEVGDGPRGAAITPDGDNVYVTNNLDGTVSVIRTSDNSVTNTINVGNSPSALDVFISGEIPEAPTDLVVNSVSDDQIDLSWKDNSSNESGFKIERKEGSKGTFTQIATVSVNVTFFNDTGLTSYTTYTYRVRAFNDAGNSRYSNETKGTPVPTICFIATAVYGSSMTEEVKVLRRFRDNILLTNAVGKAFVRIYYKVSPPVADFIAKHDSLKTIVRWGLLPLVGMSWIALKIGPCLTMVVVILLIALMLTVMGIHFRRSRLLTGTSYYIL